MSELPPHRLLRASAGTGKTYQLVQAYADAVEGGLRPADIVAITFTRKAAAELRHRITRELESRGVDEARRSELGRALIGNFHVLALQLLRGAGLQNHLLRKRWKPDSRLLGQSGEDRLLFLRCCEEAWFADDGDPQLREDVARLAPYFQLTTDLPSSLWDALSKAREDGQAIVPGDLLPECDFQAVRGGLDNELLSLRSRLAGDRGQQTAKGQEKIDAFLAATPPPDGCSLQEWAQGWAAASKLISRQGRMAQVYTVEDQALLKERVPQLLAEERCAELRPALSRLVERGWRTYQEAKGHERQVDFADLLEAVVGWLGEDEAAHRAVRESVRLVLVDEAQDTNRIQRGFVRLLAGFDGPAKGATDPASLFVVGDRKQAIYTFRGANPESFELFVQDVLDAGGSTELLEESRRSTSPMVEAINSLGGDLFPNNYEALTPLDDTAATLMTPPVVYVDTGEGEARNALSAAEEARTVARWVRQRIADGEEPGDFAVLMRTMTHAGLYAASLTELGIPAVLGGGGAFYRQEEVLDCLALLTWLSDSRDKLAAAVALRSPLFGMSDSALMALLRVPRALSTLRRGIVHPDLQLGELRRDLERLAPRFAQLVSASKRCNVASLIELIDDLFDMRAVYRALEGGPQRVSNIDRFVEIAHELDQSGRGGLARFCEEQRYRSESGFAEPVVPTLGSRGAVTIMTVHQSKGLQFPVVILADVRSIPRNDTGSVRYGRGEGVVFRPRVDGVNAETAAWAQAAASTKAEEEDERRRLLYVAVTRAKSQLAIFGSDLTGKTRKNTFADLLSSWLGRNLEAGLAQRVSAQDISGDTEALPKESSASETLRAVSIPAPARLALPVTHLTTFSECLRRGFLTYDVGLPEQQGASPSEATLERRLREPPLDPLNQGQLVHGILEGMERVPEHPDLESFVDGELRGLGYDPNEKRVEVARRDAIRFLESELGQELLALPALDRQHELPFQLEIPGEKVTLVLVGQIDLLAWVEDQPMVIDFKHATGSETSDKHYASQLDAYAAAVAQGTTEVDTRLAYVKGTQRVVKRTVGHQERAEFLASARETATEIAAVLHTPVDERGASPTWPGRPREVCKQLACGFVTRCHGPETASPPQKKVRRSAKRKAAAGQLELPW